MILRDNGEVVSNSKDDYDDMQESEDANNGEKVDYAVRELLVIRRALSAKIKVDDLE